ncbi:Uncharacterized protein OBRU01_05879, partial [Operophtera brumata]
MHSTTQRYLPTRSCPGVDTPCTCRLMQTSRVEDILTDKNHAFHNPPLSPDEELSRRGYSMYMPPDADVESGRHSD